MLAMQYTIELPADFNPSLIRERVAQRSAQFDKLKGLHHKSFLFNEQDGLYAPFYVWETDQAARDFLLHDLFKGVIDSFNRPRVRNWNVVDSTYGNRDVTPSYALREADIIPRDKSLGTLVTQEMERQQEALANPSLYFHAIALDSDRWEFLRFSIWKDRESAIRPDSDCTQSYEVLHVSGE